MYKLNTTPKPPHFSIGLFEVVSPLKKQKRIRSITDRLSLPAEILPGVPRVTMSGGSEVLVENHAGLRSYSQSCIEVRGRNGFLRISGDGLELAAMSKTDIVIRGIIASAEFC